MRGHVHVVLDHDDGVTPRHEIAEDLHQWLDVVGVKSSGRLVEDQERAGSGPQQGLGELEPLRLPTGQRVEGLTQAQVAQPHVQQWPERARKDRVVTEMLGRLLCGQLEDISDVEAHILDVEHRSDEAPPLALGTAEDDVGQELHLDRLRAVPATGLAAPARAAAE